MCYSALVEDQYSRYLRETGAEMDLEQFEEVFGMRAADPSLRILRSVERWFDDPKSPAEQRIRALIDRHQAKKSELLEEELGEYRQRIADAEAKLAIKVTKTATKEREVATRLAEKAQRDLNGLASNKPTPLDDRIFSFRFGPIVMNVAGRNVIRLARYHLRRPGDSPSVDRERLGCYNARRDSLETYWRNQFRHTHAVLLMNSFFERVTRDEKKLELHFQPEGADLMRVACLQAVWQGPDGKKLPSFALVTDEPPPEVKAAGHDRCPINLRPENVQAWLTPEGRSEGELQTLLSERQPQYYGHEVMKAA